MLLAFLPGALVFGLFTGFFPPVISTFGNAESYTPSYVREVLFSFYFFVFCYSCALHSMLALHQRFPFVTGQLA
jgi:hypothetical protein